MRSRISAIALAAGLALIGACSGTGDAPTGEADDVTTTTNRRATTSATAPGPLAKYAGYTSANYEDDAHWLCRPGRDDICDADLDSTVVAADGTLTRVPFEEVADPPVDCFYVYPTISRDPGPNSDWSASDDEEGYAAYNQVAPLRGQCRVFAPIYRQRTLAALAGRLGGGTDPAGATDPYADVLDAWSTYMARDNQGRGVVLIGHSQGAALLSQLIATEIDPDPDARALLVAAYLAGWAVTVPAGEDVGGSFDEVPLCRADDQIGCVVSWASFRATRPPVEGALFGRPRQGDGVAACTNPAALAGGAAPADQLISANRAASILASLAPDAADALPWVDPASGRVDTPFVTLPGLVTVECASRDGFDYLEVTVEADPSDPRADDIGGDLTPDWGLHLVDLNLVMGDLRRLVAGQAAIWAENR